MSKVELDEVNEFFQEAFKYRRGKLITLEKGRAVQRLEVGEENIRPGGFISGPTQMGIADSASYAAVFTEIGIVPMAVTSNLSINFLRPCIGEVVIADARVIKIGRSLAVMNVDIRAGGSDKLSSQAVVTYALPVQE